LPPDFDVVVAGGSIAGLAFANEASRQGAKVLVAEEHPKVGEPEKCDGLVSLRGLSRYGYPPPEEAIQNKIFSAVIHSPADKHFAVNSSALDVVVLHRSAYDEAVAKAAMRNGATVLTSSRVEGSVETSEGMKTKIEGKSYTSHYYVDATGPSSSPRKGILPAAKYEVEADWVREHVVEVFLDADKYPGFFAWVIPYGRHLAKMGAAGHGISPFKALEAFLADRPCRVIRKVSAPIYIGGPVQTFVRGRKILVGESAGQVKPTTAGGIMTSVAGASSAARWTCEALKHGDPSMLSKYQPEWESRFLKEMKTMLRLRSVLEKLSNDDLEALVDSMATPKVVLKLSRSDFDFHASALLGALGVQGLLKVAKVVASAEVRSLLAPA